MTIHNDFYDYYYKTIGLEFSNLMIKLNNTIIKFGIWDTAGNEMYRSLISNYYANSSLVVLVYSIENRKSFDNIQNWLNEIKDNKNSDTKIFLIGNKLDLEENRKIKEEEGETFKKVHKLDLFMEASAKTGYNVRKIFVEAVKF